MVIATNDYVGLVESTQDVYFRENDPIQNMKDENDNTDIILKILLLSFSSGIFNYLL